MFSKLCVKKSKRFEDKLHARIVFVSEFVKYLRVEDKDWYDDGMFFQRIIKAGIVINTKVATEPEYRWTFTCSVYVAVDT